tara:strand:+ start:249 stop:458 length:210 start_codon:yes stop_codon:yes gene_type:complete
MISDDGFSLRISTMTEFIVLTDLWAAGRYNNVGEIIIGEGWSPARVSEFCAYFMKYAGTSQLEILYKFL